MDYIVQTTNVTKTFRGQEAVTNVNMHVKKGEIYGFLGPNGAGKTTMLKMLNNLVKPTGGDIEIFGEKLTATSYEYLKRMGSMIEYPVFYEKLSAQENLDLHCEYMGYHNKKAIKEALDMVKLTNIEHKKVRDYSLGMKQRLGIARAIVTKPELLILDEPINGLDPVGMKEIRQLFNMLCEQYGVTLLISSHLLAEIEQIANTIGVIKAGRLLAEVSMDDIHEQNTEYIDVITTDSKKAAHVLENIMKVSNFRVVDEKRIKIYAPDMPQNEIAKTFVLHDVGLEAINRKNTTLEDYFLTLLDGGGTDV